MADQSPRRGARLAGRRGNLSLAGGGGNLPLGRAPNQIEANKIRCMTMPITAVEAKMRERQRKVRLPQPLKLVGYYAGMEKNEDVGGK